jgi:hypothetical protein
METVIEQIKLKSENIPTNNKENRRVKGAYVDCLMMLKDCNEYYTIEEVKAIVQNIYSEFAETNWKYQNTETLKGIIKIEVEQRPVKPIKIFIK